jgi:hypothetical protein
MGVSIGTAIDYLVSGTNPITGTTLLAALQAVDSEAIVVDGIEVTSSRSMVFIGKRDPGNTAANEGSQQIVNLGAGRSDEEYDIPCVAWVSRNGPTLKPARDAAIALFDVVARFVAADRSLGGALQQGRYASIGSVSLDQDVAGDAGAARVAWLSFSIHCTNHYTP